MAPTAWPGAAAHTGQRVRVGAPGSAAGRRRWALAGTNQGPVPPRGSETRNPRSLAQNGRRSLTGQRSWRGWFVFGRDARITRNQSRNQQWGRHPTKGFSVWEGTVGSVNRQVQKGVTGRARGTHTARSREAKPGGQGVHEKGGVLDKADHGGRARQPRGGPVRTPSVRPPAGGAANGCGRHCGVLGKFRLGRPRAPSPTRRRCPYTHVPAASPAVANTWRRPECPRW